jgi:hypothetical protein
MVIRKAFSVNRFLPLELLSAPLFRHAAASILLFKLLSFHKVTASGTNQDVDMSRHRAELASNKSKHPTSMWHNASNRSQRALQFLQCRCLTRKAGSAT